MHLCERCTLDVPLKSLTDGRSNKFENTIAQRQRARCVRRSNFPSIVIDARSLWVKKNFLHNDQELHLLPKELQTHWRGIASTDTPSTPVRTMWNSVRTKKRIFLQSKEFVDPRLISRAADVIKSMLDILQKIVLVICVAFHTCMENGSPILTKSSSWFIFVFQGTALFINVSH